MRHVSDEILTNIIKRKHPKKGKEKQGARTRVNASKQPKRGRSQGRKGSIQCGAPAYRLKQQIHLIFSAK